MKLQKLLSTAIIFLFLPLMFISCNKESGPIKGQGPVIEQSFELPRVKGIGLSIDANVVLTPGEIDGITIKGQQNIIDNIKKYISSDGYWDISYFRNVRNHEGVTIYITSPSIDYISISGSGSVNTANVFHDSTNVYLNISGSGNIVFKTIAQTTDSKISGSGEIVLSGSSYEHRINISGSGNVRAFDFPTFITRVDISGSGKGEVNVENLLDVKISGSGSIYYIGYPQIYTDISGSGGVYNVNN